MRFDLVSVFPEFFDVLSLSLVGKARERGILEIHAHNLRDWTSDLHRTVDDTPAGGGAGMVMRPDIWGLALDEVLGAALPTAAPRRVLAIPTPSGTPLTQATCQDLATADQIVVACGRYEGIDARVARHYAAAGVEVLEYSLGDYVLNGGEIAAVALVEAVGRLVPDMVGNPESLVEESFSKAGLLEYPVFTRPVAWRGEEIPEVLMSGDHGAVARWRRQRAMDRTKERRPEILAELDAARLDKKDRRYLATLGYLTPRGAAHPMPARIREATPADVAELSDFAIRTFPDACPPDLGQPDIDAYIEANLTPARFEAYVADPLWLALILEVGGRIVGYTLSLLPETADGVAAPELGTPVDAVVGEPRRGGLVELSKVYVDRAYRGLGATDLLLRETLARLAAATVSEAHPNPYVWLGTSATNVRARRAYRKAGFEKVGRREFLVGDKLNEDVVLARPLAWHN